MAADINFYGLLYEFHRTSTNGADILITIEKKWYEGEVKQRALGRAPVIKRENKDHIFGTSCELYAECLVDGEYADMYTSDPFEFRVSVYKDETLLWQGFVSPELYSEPDAAPPYDVQITATDGLGELKNSIYEERGAASILSHIMGLIGQYPIYVISGLRYVDSTGAISQDHDILNVSIDLDHEKGNSKYDVLQNLLTSLNANITQLNGRYVIFRETDFINKATDEGVEAFDVNGEKVYISIASFGSMTSHQWWPIGQLSTVVEPAKNSLVLQAPNHYKDNVLDFSQWSVLNSAEYDATEDAYILPDEGSYITQALDFDNEVGYRLGLRIRARNVGDSEEDQNIGLMIKVNARTYAAPEGRDFWLVKSEVSTGNARTDYLWRGQEDYFEEALNMPSDADTASDAQNVDIVIPLYDHSQNGLSYIFASSLSIKIFNPAGIHDIYVYDISLVKYEQSEGYEAKVVINNAAREAESDIDLSMSSASFAPAAGNMFMTGLPMQADGLLIEQWQIPGSAAQEYLSAMSYDYARAVALPKMKYSGVLNVPDTATILPILFLRDGTFYFPKTYTYDLFNDEIQVELISISAADVSLSSVVISQYAESSGNMGGVTTGGGGGGSVISLPRDKVMSDTSDNAVENRVIKAYVDSEVKELADLLTSMWCIEDNKIVTDMDVLIKANLIVEKDTSSGGEGEDTPAEGTVTGIEVNGTPYGPNTQGVIDLSAAFNAIDVSDQLEDYYTKPETDSAISTAIANLINGAPTTLDTLKEIADALAENKDVVDALDEAIGKKADKATTLAEYGITDANISNDVITLGMNTITPLTSHQTIYSLRLNNSAGEQIVKFEPNVKSSEINLTKAMVGLDLVENTKLSTWAGTNNITTLGTITSGTWQGSRVSKSYLDANLVAWFDAVSPLLVKDSSGNIKVSTNLIVTGDTSSGGSGSDTPASGTVTGVTVGSTDYTDVNAGLLNLTSLMNLYTPLTSHNALATRVSTLEGGSATAISVTGSGNVISGVSKSGTTITFTKGVTALTEITKSMVDSVLGGTASSNANKFLMCTGSTTVWSAVTKSMVASALGASTGGRYLIDTGGDLGWGTIPTKLSQFTDDVVSGKYLPLAGGRMTGTILVGDYTAFGQTGGNFYLGTPAYSLLLRSNGTTTINGNTLIHSGNIGDYAVKYNGYVSNESLNSVGMIDQVGAYAQFGYSNYRISFRCTTGNGLSYKGWHGSEPTSWKTIAFTDSTVDKAKILVDANNAYLVYKTNAGNLYVGDNIYTSGDTHILGNNIRLRYGESASYGLILNSSGNVGIGTTSPAYRLDVNGGVRFGTGSGCDVWLNRTSGNSYINAVDSVAITTGNNSGNIALELYANKSAKFYGAVTMSSTLSVTGGSYCYGDAFFGAGKEGIYISSSGQSIAWHNTSNTYVEMMMSFASSSVLVYQELRPNANNSLTLGTSSYRWSTIYGTHGNFSASVTATTSVVTPLLQSSGGLDIVANGSAAGSRLYLTTNVFRPWGDDAGLIDLGVSSIRWRSVYSVGGNFSGAVSIGDTLTVTAGGAKVTGDTTINGNLVVSGDVASA